MRFSLPLAAALAALFLLLAGGGFGCGPIGGPRDGSDGESTDTPPVGRLTLATSLPPLATLVERVAGDRAEVFSLLSPGDSPASFQVPDATVTALARSAIYFRVGVPFENGPWFDAVSALRSVRVVDLRAGVELVELETPDEHDREGVGEHLRGGKDPHIWLAPDALATMATTAAAALCEVDAEGCVGYRTRAGVLRAELEELELDIRGVLDPIRGTEFYVFHPSWGYFARSFGLRQVAVEREGKMPTEAALAELRRRAEASGAVSLFVQPQIGGGQARAAAEGLGLEVEILDPLASDPLTNLRSVATKIASRGAP